MKISALRIVIVALYGGSLLALWPTLSLFGAFAKGVILFCFAYGGLIALGQVVFLSGALWRGLTAVAGTQAQEEFISPDDFLDIESEAI